MLIRKEEPMLKRPFNRAFRWLKKEKAPVPYSYNMEFYKLNCDQIGDDATNFMNVFL